MEAVTRVARSKMGLLSRGATGEFGMLAHLLAPDEPILAMAIGRVEGRGWFFAGRLVVATPERLLIVGKAMITRRERVEEIPLARVKDARAVPPWTLELELDDGTLRLSHAGPPPQLSALAEAARGRSTPTRFEELDELARRKLGRLRGFGVEGSLVALAEELSTDEDVVDLASCAGKPGGVVVVCDARLVAVSEQGFGRTTRTSMPFADITEIRDDGRDLVVRTQDSEHRYRDLVPLDQASVIANRVRARLTTQPP